MQLIGSPTSPYVRKARVYLAETGIACEFVAVDAWQPDARLLGMAPLGKVPVLVRDDGGSWDVGYPRAWEYSPGRVGVVYYYNTKDDPVQVKATGKEPWGEGGVRFIARSFFDVD